MVRGRLRRGIAAWFALGSPAEWQAFLCIAAALRAGRLCDRPGGRAGALGWFALAAAARLRSGVGACRRGSRSRGSSGRIVTEFAANGRYRSSILPRARRSGCCSTPRIAALPPQVRVSIDEDKFPAGIAPGAEIQLRARLAPPPPMALPGTYDFARDAWFKGIGAVGKALGPRPVLDRPAPRRARPGAREPPASTSPRACPRARPASPSRLVTGDQNAVDQDDADAMRRSGLTHLLSVSGLHIAAVVAFAMLADPAAARA